MISNMFKFSDETIITNSQWNRFETDQQIRKLYMMLCLFIYSRRKGWLL